jgi:putative Mg2+ transporter-C (MgtC) family protein
VAAQIVSGIGFIGGGLIFVRRDAVRGLTTAASVWLTTAVGMASGAALPVLAAATTLGYLIVMYAFTPLAIRLQQVRPREQLIEVTYPDGRGLLRRVLNTCTAQGWIVAHLSTRHRTRDGTVAVLIKLRGPGGYPELAGALTEVDGVLAVRAANPDDVDIEAQ